jgi:glycosyltransferase involved in cell wall biosynthesis
MARATRRGIRLLVDLLAAMVGVPLIAVGALLSLRPGGRRRPPSKPRILWGSQPIKALAWMAESARRAGYDGEVMVRELFSIYPADHFDHLVFARNANPAVHRLVDSLKAYWFCARALGRYDAFAYYFDGGILRRTLLQRCEVPLLKLLGKKLVLIPYGSDAWVADHMPVLWRAALLIDDPALGSKARAVERQLRQGARHADCVLGCMAHIACLPRWDILPLTCYPVDTHAVEPVWPSVDGPVRIVHAANHRGFKGTDFLIAAVARLRAEGHDVELDVVERTTNDDVLRRMARADVYVDQLVAGYAFAALEAMALGKVVVSPVDGNEVTQVFRRYSYLDECPIVDASPETIYEVLRGLIADRATWREAGRASREFCERRHSFEASTEMWDAIFRRIWFGEDVDLISFYRPLAEPAPLDGRGSVIAE